MAATTQGTAPAKLTYMWRLRDVWNVQLFIQRWRLIFSRSKDPLQKDRLMPEQVQTAFERHLQTGLHGLVVAILAYIGVQVMETKETVIRHTAEVEYLQTEVAALRDEARSSYTRADAQRDFARVNANLTSYVSRLRSLEQEVILLRRNDLP